MSRAVKIRPGDLVRLAYNTMYSESGDDPELLGGASICCHNVGTVLFIMSERRSLSGSVRVFILSNNVVGWVWNTWIKSRISA